MSRSQMIDGVWEFQHDIKSTTMNDEYPNHSDEYSILAQIPLIVSPSLRKPNAVTLPFSYKQIPKHIPNSSVSRDMLEQIINDSTGFLESSKTRHESLSQAYYEWDTKFRENDIQERRKIAPGYLDTSSRLLEPEQLIQKSEEEKDLKDVEEPESELDKVFGKTKISD